MSCCSRTWQNGSASFGEGVAEPMKEAHVQFVQNVLDRCGHCPFNEKFASEAFYCILDKFIG